jgi:hypothetical protein
MFVYFNHIIDYMNTIRETRKQENKKTRNKKSKK